MERALLEGPPRRKGERSRARLLVATAAAMAETGFEAPRLRDITGRTGMSTGVFYVYFRDLADGAGQVLEGFADWLFRRGATTRPQAGAHQQMEGWLGALLERADGNRGLLRAMERAMETSPAYAESVRGRRLAWIWAMMGEAGPANARALLAASAVDTLIAGLLREIAVFDRSPPQTSRVAAAVRGVLAAAPPLLAPVA